MYSVPVQRVALKVVVPLVAQSSVRVFLDPKGGQERVGRPGLLGSGHPLIFSLILVPVLWTQSFLWFSLSLSATFSYVCATIT